LPEGDALSLPKGWVETTLGKVIEIYSGKTRPKKQGAYPVYGGNGILNYGDKFNQEGETIIVGRVGAYCGNVFYETQPFWLSDNALGLKANEISHEKFLYYKLVSMKLNNHAIGGAQPLLTQTLLKELEINLPPLPEQKAIADMLSSLDDKIELLREQNKTLETLAQTIFKEWSVHFNFPVCQGTGRPDQHGLSACGHAQAGPTSTACLRADTHRQANPTATTAAKWSNPCLRADTHRQANSA